MAQFAREKQVVCATLSDHYLLPFAIDLFMGADDRFLANHIAPLNQHIGRRKPDPLASQWIHGEKSDVGTLIDNGFDRLPGCINKHQIKLYAEPFCKCG